MNRDMTKPTKWLCAQRRLRSAWASAQSDPSLLPTWRKLESLATHWVHSEDSDQTGRMPRLIWVFAERTLILLVLSCRGSNRCHIVWLYFQLLNLCVVSSPFFQDSLWIFKSYIFLRGKGSPYRYHCTWRYHPSLLPTWRKLESLATHWVHSEDSDQTGRMPRLIWVFAERTLILLVLSCRGSNRCHIVWLYFQLLNLCVVSSPFFQDSLWIFKSYIFLRGKGSPYRYHCTWRYHFPHSLPQQTMDPSGEPSVGYMTIKPEMKMNIYEPRQEKTCLWGLRPVKTRIGLLGCRG